MHYNKAFLITYNKFIISEKNMKSKLDQIENLNLFVIGNLLKTY